MIIVSGANGVVGRPLCELLTQQGREYLGVSRKPNEAQEMLEWDMSTTPNSLTRERLSKVSSLIHCAPIWLLPAHLDLLRESGLQRLVVFSSTSVLSKRDSQNNEERHLVAQLRDSEKALQEYCGKYDLKLYILRPSLIYGYGRDQNVSHIANFIRRFGFMLLAGRASGLRQPVHADDLAAIALVCLEANSLQSSYNLAGQDTISYREMVTRIFVGLGRRPIIISIPLWLFRPALRIAAKLGHFSYTPEMATRMNQNLNYDYRAASEDLGFSPQGFLEKPDRDLVE